MRKKNIALLQKQLRKLRIKNPNCCCWVCNSNTGMKTSRMSYGVRCKRCIHAHKTNEDVTRYQTTYKRLQKFLKKQTII